MNSSDLKHKAVINLAWKFAERCGAQVVTFIVSIVLARLLQPADYGIISIVTVFISIFQVFIDSGLGVALIQKRDADNLDFSTVFYCNVVICLVLYLLLYMCAPVIAIFYNNSDLISIIRVLGLTLIISGVRAVQQAYVSRNMIFKKFFFATIGSTVFSAIVGIVMAYDGYGVWALVLQQLLNGSIGTIILWITVNWRPSTEFSWKRLQGLFSYGSKVLVSNLINVIYNDIRQLIIGKAYSSADLAYYNRGKQFPALIVDNVNTSIDSVLLPVMSEQQDDKTRLKTMTRRSILISGYVMWPMMLGLMAVGKDLVLLVLTDKWIPVVPYLYIFCFVYGMQPIHTANLNAIKAMGRSDLLLRMEIIKKSVGIIIILLTMNLGVFAIGMGSVVYTLFASIVNVFPNRKLLDYKYLEQIKDIFPSLGMASLMACIVYGLPFERFPIIVAIILRVIIGIFVYLVESIILRHPGFRYIEEYVKGLIKRK